MTTHSSQASNIVVKRHDGVSWTDLTTFLATTVTTYSDTPSSYGGYNYLVACKKANDEYGASDVVGVTTDACPTPTPTPVIASCNTSTASPNPATDGQDLTYQATSYSSGSGGKTRYIYNSAAGVSSLPASGSTFCSSTDTCTTTADLAQGAKVWFLTNLQKNINNTNYFCRWDSQLDSSRGLGVTPNTNPIPSRTSSIGVRSPATIVIGEVVRLREQLLGVSIQPEIRLGLWEPFLAPEPRRPTVGAEVLF